MGNRVFGRGNHFSFAPSHPGQLSLLPPAERKISTIRSAEVNQTVHDIWPFPALVH